MLFAAITICSGSSRSVSVCMAWFMYDMKVEYDFLFPDVLALHPLSCPNPLFERQLRLFEEFGYTFKGDTPAHRRYKLSRQLPPGPTLSKTIPEGKEKEEEEKAAEEEEEEEATNTDKAEVGEDVDAEPCADDDAHDSEFDEDDGAEQRTAEFSCSCRCCRTFLFTDLNCLGHGVNDIARKHDWKNFGGNSSQTSAAVGRLEPCTSMFVEPMGWMDSGDGSMFGKLHCPKCQVKIGQYSWHGLRCSCGKWQAPAFQVHLSKVDKMRVASSDPKTHGIVAPSVPVVIHV